MVVERIHKITFKGKEKVHIHLKWLCTLLFLASFCLGAFLIAVVVVYTKQSTCLTRGCITAASKTLAFLNLSVNPCDDFYEFACGNYRKEILPDDETEVSVFNTIQKTVQSQLRTLLQDANLLNRSKPYRSLGQLYNLCMNTINVQRDGLNFAKHILRGLGGWPLLEGNSWNERNFDWIQLIHELRRNGLEYNYFFNFGIEPDRKNSSQRVLVLDQILPKLDEHLVSAKFSSSNDYFNYVVSIAEIFGANKIKIESEAREFIRFAQKLALMYVPQERRKNHTLLYNPITIAELHRKIPTIDWLRCIEGIVNIPTTQIRGDEVVVLSDLGYFETLSGLLRRTPKRVQANYIITNTVLSMVPLLTEEVLRVQERYNQVLTGVLYRKPRWKLCLDIISKSLPLPLSALYVKKYFKNESMKSADQIIQNVKDQFTTMLKLVDWLDGNTRRHALEKAAVISATVGYPHQLLDDKLIEEYYARLDMSSNSLIKAIMNVSLFNENREYEKLRRIVDKPDWIEHSSFTTEVNAFYTLEENSIDFPSAILQDVFFDSERPNYMNYGTLGFVAGHEITHGFDDQGKQFDKQGNLNEWWSADTAVAFRSKSQCFTEQYNNYVEPNVETYVNGQNTLGENIADNGGIKEAYLAYRNWVKRNGHELKLPGLDYTPYQMFWISAAQLWCFKARLELISELVYFDVHSPPRFRVIGSFSNSEQFSNDFNCAPNSFMNPQNKCSVW
ncbi:neprilysin-2-like [Photinus pyralis]|uniref:neprilysin-2-like n=1 Tax=Photinus pyralis TaxID=7054 RepID=UPI00126722BF|nr:neprilysin-2-like [Photinus pyralis]